MLNKHIRYAKLHTAKFTPQVSKKVVNSSPHSRYKSRSSPVIQWLRCYTSNAGDAGSNPDQELRSHMLCGKKKKKMKSSLMSPFLSHLTFKLLDSTYTFLCGVQSPLYCYYAAASYQHLSSWIMQYPSNRSPYISTCPHIVQP